MITFSMYLHDTKDSNVWMMPSVSVPELTDQEEEIQSVVCELEFQSMRHLCQRCQEVSSRIGQENRGKRLFVKFLR